MSTPAPPKPGPAPQPQPQPTDDPEVVPVPPDEEFWEKYNRHFEFPFSTVGAVLLHVGVACLLVVLWAKMRESAADKDAVPLVISPVDGLGEGSPGADLGIDPISKNDEEIKAPITADEIAKLPEVLESVKDVLPDPTGVQIPDKKLADFADVDKELARKLLRGDGTKGNGPGGFGSDSAPAQSLRWTIRFSTRSGADYLYQLGLLGAKLLIPVAGDRKYMLYEDLSADAPRGRLATEQDLDNLAREVRFFDRDRRSIQQVADALRLNERPRQLIAFLPKSLRDDLAAKEKGFAGATSKEIEETIMMVNRLGGRADVVVIEQKLRNGKWIKK